MDVAAMDGKKTSWNHISTLKLTGKCVCERENLHSYSDSSWKLWFMQLLAFLLTVEENPVSFRVFVVTIKTTLK